jgi:hypothetical protein
MRISAERYERLSRESQSLSVRLFPAAELKRPSALPNSPAFNAESTFMRSWSILGERKMQDWENRIERKRIGRTKALLSFKVDIKTGTVPFRGRALLGADTLPIHARASCGADIGALPHDSIKHSIDELIRIVRPEFLCELDGFVDRDCSGNVLLEKEGIG